MPRIRTIQPKFWTDEKVGKLKREVRLLFIGMWQYADDYGTIQANPILLKSQIFPYDEDLRTEVLIQWLDALVNARMIEPFSLRGEGFYNIRTFLSYQKVEKPSKPIVSIQEKNGILEQSVNSRVVLPDISTMKVVSSNSNSKGNITTNVVIENPKEFSRKRDSFFDAYADSPKTKTDILAFISKHKPQFFEPYHDLWCLFATEYGFPVSVGITPERRKKFNTRIQEKEFDFIAILSKAAKSDFMRENKFFTIGWVLESRTNYLKVLEGIFDNKAGNEAKKLQSALIRTADDIIAERNKPQNNA